MKKTIFILLSLSALAVCKSQPNYVNISGLRGYWPFDQVNMANDVFVGYISTLSPPANPPAPCADRFGTSGSAYDFNGAGAINTPFAGILGDSARAISVWAKTPGNGGNAMYIVGWGGNSNGNRFGGFLDYPGGKVSVGGADCIQPFSNTSSSSDNQWHHYVFQFSTSYGPSLKDVKAWQDAVEIYTTTVGTYNPSYTLSTVNNFNVTFGQIIYPAAPAYYTGQLDEVGIWKRILTQCEISDLYHADVNLGSMTFNISGYSGSVFNLAQYTQTVTGNAQFSTSIAPGVYSGTGVTLNGFQYDFNSPPTLPPGTYTITHTYTLQGGCVRTNTQTIDITSKGNVGMQELQKDKASPIELYPNPSGNYVTLINHSSRDDLQLKIIDLNGKVVYATPLSDSENIIDLSALTDGLYFIETQNQASDRVFKKLVIAR